MTLNYTPLVEIDDVGVLAVPFRLAGPAAVALHDRIWIDRGQFLNRYSGEVEILATPPGFGVGGFGSGIFGWS